MRRHVEGEVRVHYGQIYVESDPESFGPDLAQAFAGQRAGLCGAAIPGALWLTTGLHTGHVGFTVEVHDQAPPLDPVWEEAVEVSFRPASARSVLLEWAGSATWELGLDETDYRARYCAQGMDQAHRQDTRIGGPQLDRYLLQFWPAAPGPDRVLKQTSEIAAYWHEFARTQPPPATPEQRADAERHARLAREQADLEARRAREERQWGGRLPSPALRHVGGNVRGVLRFDAALVHAIDAAGPRIQRTVALLAARRACEVAGLSSVDWIAAALAALAEGRALPPPFADPARMFETLRSDPQVPHRTVRRAIPPHQAALPPPIPPRAQAPRPPSVPRRPDPGTQPKAVAAARHATTVGFGPPDPSVRVSQPHMALPAVTAAARTDPLRAALDAVSAGIAAHGENYPAFLEEIWSAVRAG